MAELADQLATEIATEIFDTGVSEDTVMGLCRVLVSQPNERKLVFWLRVAGLKYREIGAVIGITSGTACNWLHRQVKQAVWSVIEGGAYLS